MCRHVNAAPICFEGPAGQKTELDVRDLLGDIEESLDLSRKLLLLAAGPWKECSHAGGLPLEPILRECASRIIAEAWRCRIELEASGRVQFGYLVIEESADSDGQQPAEMDISQWDSPPVLAGQFENSAALAFAETSPQAISCKTEPAPLLAFRRIYGAIFTRLAQGESRWSARESKQGGE